MAGSVPRFGPRIGPRAEILLFALLVLGLGLLCLRFLGSRLYGITPTVAALAVIVLTHRVGPPGWMSLGLDRPGFRGWPAAVFIPLFALGTAIVVAWQLEVTALRLPDTQGPLHYVLVAAGVIAIASIGALGEEIGWRGFLLPRLAPYGRVMAGLAMGALWETWHILSIGFQPSHVVAVFVIAFCANEVAMATRSVWPAALFHGANNAIAGLTGGLAVGATSALPSIAGTAGWVTIGVYALVALAIVALRKPWSRADNASRHPMTIDRLPVESLGR